jgi:CysZ protein
MVINLIIYGTIFFFSYKWIIGTSGELTGAFNLEATWLQEILHVMILIMSFLLLLLVCYFLFITIGGLINAPFAENISQMVEEIITESKYDNELSFWTDAWYSIKAEFVKLIFYFLIIIPIFFIGFIPMVGGVLATILGTLFSFFYNALDYLDYPMTRRFFRLKKKIKITHSGGLLTYGFGCMAFIMLFLPVVNVFFKPVLVVAGTSLFYEKGFAKQLKYFKI